MNKSTAGEELTTAAQRARAARQALWSIPLAQLPKAIEAAKKAEAARKRGLR